MFVLCPHCQFLVALTPATGQAPADCPRCGKPLQPTAVARPDEAAAARADAGSTRERSQRRESTKPRENLASPSPPPARRARRASTSIDGRDAPASEPVAEGSARAGPDAGAEADPIAEPIAAAVDAAATLAGPATSLAMPAPSPDTALSAVPEARAPAPHPDSDVPQAVASAPRPDIAAPPDADAAASGTAVPLAADATTPASVPSAALAGATAATPETATPAPGPRRRLPSFAHPLQRAPSARPGRGTTALLAGLVLLLVLQLLLADRARLATDARWRPLLSTLCTALQCRLPAWHEPAAFVLLARDVRPAREGVLHVSATFRNDARWTQSWPALRLALQDVDGRTVGARTLRPDEYLGGDAHRTQSGLAPGQSVQVAFDIAEPAATVVAFTFDFH